MTISFSFCLPSFHSSPSTIFSITVDFPPILSSSLWPLLAFSLISLHSSSLPPPLFSPPPFLLLLLLSFLQNTFLSSRAQKTASPWRSRPYQTGNLPQWRGFKGTVPTSILALYHWISLIPRPSPDLVLDSTGDLMICTIIIHQLGIDNFALISIPDSELLNLEFSGRRSFDSGDSLTSTVLHHYITLCHITACDKNFQAFLLQFADQKPNDGEDLGTRVAQNCLLLYGW